MNCFWFFDIKASFRTVISYRHPQTRQFQQKVASLLSIKSAQYSRNNNWIDMEAAVLFAAFLLNLTQSGHFRVHTQLILKWPPRQPFWPGLMKWRHAGVWTFQSNYPKVLIVEMRLMKLTKEWTSRIARQALWLTLSDCL